MTSEGSLSLDEESQRDDRKSDAPRLKRKKTPGVLSGKIRKKKGPELAYRQMVINNIRENLEEMDRLCCKQVELMGLVKIELEEID